MDLIDRAFSKPGYPAHAAPHSVCSAEQDGMGLEVGRQAFLWLSPGPRQLAHVAQISIAPHQTSPFLGLQGAAFQNSVWHRSLPGGACGCCDHQDGRPAKEGGHHAGAAGRGGPQEWQRPAGRSHEGWPPPHFLPHFHACVHDQCKQWRLLSFRRRHLEQKSRL